VLSDVWGEVFVLNAGKWPIINNCDHINAVVDTINVLHGGEMMK
jgi:hypothetical protein